MSFLSEVSIFNFSSYKFEDIQPLVFSRAKKEARVFIKDKHNGYVVGGVSRLVYEEMSRLHKKKFLERKRCEGLQKREIYRYVDAIQASVEKKVEKKRAAQIGLVVDNISKKYLARVGKDQFVDLCNSLKNEVNFLLNQEEIKMYCERRKSAFASLGISAGHLDKIADKYVKRIGATEYSKLEAALKSEIDELLKLSMLGTFLLPSAPSDKDSKDAK